MPTKQQIKLFISHSSEDKELASALLETIHGLFDVSSKSIRCTSVVGYQLHGGANIMNSLHSDIQNTKVVIGIITANFIKSPWCLYELGASWGIINNLIPLVAGIDLDEIKKGPLGFSQLWRLDDINDIRTFLDEIKRSLSIKRRLLDKSTEENILENLVKTAIKCKIELEETISPDELYTLRFNPERMDQKNIQIRSRSDIFQDFDVSRSHGNNANAVHFLWADTYTNSSIRALIIKNINDNYLRIWFDNEIRREEQGEKAQPYACNVGILPQDDFVENMDENGKLRHTILQFYARIPNEEFQESHIKDVGISVRLADRRLTSWVYREALFEEKPTQFRVQNSQNSWQPCKLSLKDGHYSLFRADSNRLYLKYNEGNIPIPDFTILTGLTIVVGAYSGGREEPRAGKGVIDVKDIRLTKS